MNFLFFFMLLPLVVIILLLFDAGIVYLAGKALGGRGSFTKAIYGVAAFSTPASIIAIIAVILATPIKAISSGTTSQALAWGAAILVVGGFIYLNYLNIILAQAIHGISLGKAFVVHSSVYVVATIMCCLIVAITLLINGQQPSL